MYLEKDPETETHFKTFQYDVLPHVYRLDGMCRTFCEVNVEVSSEAIVDLRKATRRFENDGYSIEVTSETKSDGQHMAIRVYAEKSDSHINILVRIQFNCG